MFYGLARYGFIAYKKSERASHPRTPNLLTDGFWPTPTWLRQHETQSHPTVSVRSWDTLALNIEIYYMHRQEEDFVRLIKSFLCSTQLYTVLAVETFFRRWICKILQANLILHALITFHSSKFLRFDVRLIRVAFTLRVQVFHAAHLDCRFRKNPSLFLLRKQVSGVIIMRR